MTTYRIELQMPYGTLVDVYEGPHIGVARKKKRSFLRRGRGAAFVPCFINGVEVPPTAFNQREKEPT